MLALAASQIQQVKGLAWKTPKIQSIQQIQKEYYMYFCM